jgi:hypothetical protein
MRAVATIAVGLVMGCSGPEESTDSFTHPFTSQHETGTGTSNGTVTDTDTDTDTDPGTLPTGLNGDVPAQALPPPDFSQVVARNGTLASPADLVGRPTVLWFYPAAFTGG